MNRRNSLSEQPRNQNPRKRAQGFRRRVFTDVREPHIDSSRPQANRVAKSGVRVKTNFNRGHTAVSAHMTKRVGEKFGYFIHCG
jgi:hypothetical protein